MCIRYIAIFLNDLRYIAKIDIFSFCFQKEIGC